VSPLLTAIFRPRQRSRSEETVHGPCSSERDPDVTVRSTPVEPPQLIVAAT